MLWKKCAQRQNYSPNLEIAPNLVALTPTHAGGDEDDDEDRARLALAFTPVRNLQRVGGNVPPAAWFQEFLGDKKIRSINK
jgi:hypothetical protein